MLYFEDYLEMIEHLPQELRDRFTDMREMDLQVQNAVDTLDERVKAFFANAKRISNEQQEEECRRICEDYQRAILDAEEKVQIANQIYDLVERYLRKLDQELQKFKIELEADNAGITEILEKRSLELDNTTPATATQPAGVTPQPSRHGEKRRASASTHTPISHSGSSQHGGSGHTESKKQHVDKMHAPEPLIRTNPVTPNTLAPPARVASPLSRASSADSTRSADVLATSGPLGLGSQAIAAAASQAIAATQQMQQGRRSASLKASYEAIAVQNLAAREFTLGSRDIASLTPTGGGNSAAGGTTTASGTTSGAHSTPTTTTAAAGGAASGVSLSSSISALLEAPLATPTSRKSSKKARPSANQTSSANSAAHHLLDSTTDTASNANSFGSSTLAAAEEPPVTETPAQANTEWQYDPNEPRYCICNQVSYGDMVACDNEGCPFEWFHYPCVNISQPPKGKWFCPQCTASMKRRGKLR